ncbi:MAG: CRTAC1 family protein, partial [Planctomycetaceae bacterium]
WERWAATSAFGDLDLDGDLDLYVTCYADVPATGPTPVCTENGVRIHCHPHYYEAVPDILLENRGDGTFTDRSNAWGIADEVEYGLGVIIADLIQGGVPEIFVANDGDRNLLFQRNSNGRYEDVASRCGIAFNGNGQSMGSMGIACADFDGNGEFDILTTNFTGERNVLFSNLSNGVFVDQSAGSRIDKTSRTSVGWGAVPLDADNDTWIDLFIANGNVTGMATVPYRQEPLMYHGLPDGRFEQACTNDPYFQTPWHARGAFLVDLAGDARPDIVVSHVDDSPRILKNESAVHGNWLFLNLIGVAANRDAAATTVIATLGSRKVVRQTIQSAGYLSTSAKVLHFGLGNCAAIEVLEIRWPGGNVQTLHNVPANVHLDVIEGRSVYRY